MERVNKYKTIFIIGIIDVLFYYRISNFEIIEMFMNETSTLLLGIILSFYGALGLILSDFFGSKK